MQKTNTFKTNTLMWSIRLAALTVGGSVSAMAIAALVTAIPTSPRSFPNPSNHSEPPPSPSPHVQPLPQRTRPDPSTLPSVYPLTPPIPPSVSPLSISPLTLGLSPTPPSSHSTDALHENPEEGVSHIPSPDFDGNRLKTVEESREEKAAPTANAIRTNASTIAATPDLANLPLDLQDVVVLALENNRDIKNAYLDRIIQEESLRVAEDRFNPDFTPSLTVTARRDDQGFSTSNRGDIELETGMEVLLPTGTTLAAGWSATGDAQNTIGLSSGSSDGLRQQISVTVTHPLWRNSGEAITRAPLEIARLEDEQNIWALQTTLINTITRAGEVYLDLVLAQQELEIEEAGLVRTEAELERIEVLIEVGRLAAIERIAAEADVANRRVDVLNAQDSLRDAQLNLIQELDIDQTVLPMATEANALSQGRIRFTNDDALVEYAFAHNPDYRAQLLDLDVADLQLRQAEDRLGWDLNLEIGYRNGLSSRSPEQSEARASLQLSRELGDRSLKQQVIAQRTRIERLNNTQTERRENLEIGVRNAIRNVDFQQTQVEQAQRATQLEQQQLDITQIKFQQGDETFLEVLQAQDNLVTAQNQELRAQIGYQNALLRLDQELGHTLETWNIQIRPVND